MARMKYEANGITIEISHGSCVPLRPEKSSFWLKSGNFLIYSGLLNYNKPQN